MFSRVFLSVGSNLGDRMSYLRDALSCIRDLDALAITRVSSVYRTEALGGQTDKEFLNAVIACESECDPRNLIPILKAIERRVGRKERTRWGDREIDIDVLYAGDAVVTTTEAKIPHPEISKRRFVLVPLCELAAAFVDPLTGQRMKDLLAACPGNERVERLMETL